MLPALLDLFQFGLQFRDRGLLFADNSIHTAFIQFCFTLGEPLFKF